MCAKRELWKTYKRQIVFMLRNVIKPKSQRSKR